MADDAIDKGQKKKPQGITHLTGIALGVCRLSFDDFLRLTPSELEAVWAAHAKEAEDRERGLLERMRAHAFLTISPHVGKKSNLTPEKLMPLPWDKENKPAEREPLQKVELTREQTNARVRELLASGI